MLAGTDLRFTDPHGPMITWRLDVDIPGLGVEVARVECLRANAAVMRAESLSRKQSHAGAVAFARTGDPSSGDFSVARLSGSSAIAGRSERAVERLTIDEFFETVSRSDERYELVAA